jgi:hypothetical protein
MRAHHSTGQHDDMGGLYARHAAQQQAATAAMAVKAEDSCFIG